MKRLTILSFVVVLVLSVFAWQSRIEIVPRATTQAAPTDGKTLVWLDNFQTNTLEANKWSSCFPGGNCTHEENNELQCYSPNNISFSNGRLHLNAKKETMSCNGKSYDYTSALLQTRGKFEFTYGYVEVKAKTPAGVGLWSTVWALPVDGSWPPEMDVLEQIGGVKDTNFMSVHYGSNGDNKYVQQTYTGADMTVAYHTYGMDWKQDRVDFYFDGVKVASYVNKYNVPNKPMYLIMNLAVGGTATPPPDQTTQFPAFLGIESIKVYK